MWPKTRIEELDAEALHALERKHQALLPAGFGADAKGATFADFDWLALLCGVFFSLPGLLCVVFSILFVIALDEVGHEFSQFMVFAGITFTAFSVLISVVSGVFCFSKCRTRLWFVTDGKTFFFRWKNLFRGKALVFDRDDIDFADVAKEGDLKRPTLYLFSPSDKAVPLYTVLHRVARYMPYFARVSESLDPTGGKGGCASARSLHAFAECRRRQYIKAVARDVRILSPGIKEFEKMRGRLYSERDGADSGVRHMAQFRLGRRMPRILLDSVGVCPFICLLVFMVALASELKEVDDWEFIPLLTSVIEGNPFFAFFAGLSPLVYLAVFCGAGALCLLNIYVAGSHCLSLEEGAAVLCRVRPWKITRQRIAKADIGSIVRTSIIHNAGKKGQFEVVRIDACLRDGTVTELLVMTGAGKGVAAWLGEISAWWLGVPYEEREEVMP